MKNIKIGLDCFQGAPNVKEEDRKVNKFCRSRAWQPSRGSRAAGRDMGRAPHPPALPPHSRPEVNGGSTLCLRPASFHTKQNTIFLLETRWGPTHWARPASAESRTTAKDPPASRGGHLPGCQGAQLVQVSTLPHPCADSLSRSWATSMSLRSGPNPASLPSGHLSWNRKSNL